MKSLFFELKRKREGFKGVSREAAEYRRFPLLFAIYLFFR